MGSHAVNEDGGALRAHKADPHTAAAEHGWRVLAVLSGLMGFASISTDLYLPAMPEMGRALGTSAGTIEFTVSGYLIGFALGQLFWGPVSDRYGRRLPVAVGLVLFVIGSAGCALSYDAGTMIFWRMVQAIGASAGVVLSRAMVRDLYEGPRAAQMMSSLMTVMAIAPLRAPAPCRLKPSKWSVISIGQTRCKPRSPASTR
ncbi:MFS transporter [Xanthobacter sp. 91]|uniref:MFS transporter n=1 Tax=Xanthobacter sp. 91 TaxID=1117244 RepID=UPI001FDA7845|nr:MFS transporter [Xanthobacter sp. 91]